MFRVGFYFFLNPTVSPPCISNPGHMWSRPYQRTGPKVATMAMVRIATFFALWCLSNAELSSPNLVFVLLDDVGFADLGFNRHQPGPTAGPLTDFVSMSPRIDSLAAKGVRFAQHYVHPTCTPSRAALMTGLYSSNTGLTIAAMPGSVSGLPLSLVTIPQLLRQRGYEAHMVGKWHLGHAQWAQTPVGRGFQTFSGVRGIRINNCFPSHFLSPGPLRLSGVDVPN